MDENTPELTKNIADLMKSLRQIAGSLDRRSKRVARETGLTIPQIVVLQAVRHFGKLTTSAISRDADLSPATTVTILDKLEAKGLVKRKRSATDRRIVHTLLTKQGTHTLSGAPPLFDARFVEGLARLPEDEQRTIVSAFRTVADLLAPGTS